mgnify:CR=1 FL=1
MSEPLLRHDRDDRGVVTLTLNRPRAMNSLGVEMGKALLARVQELQAAQGVKAIIVTGAGEHFMAGGDIKEFHTIVAAAPEASAWLSPFKRSAAAAQPRTPTPPARPIPLPEPHSQIDDPQPESRWYPAQWSVVTDETGQLVGCQGIVGDELLKQMLLQRIATVFFSANCEVLVQQGYQTTLIDLEVFERVVGMIKDRPNMMIALNINALMPQHIDHAQEGSIVISGADPQEVDNIRLAIAEFTGQAFTLAPLAWQDEAQALMQREQLMSAHLERLAQQPTWRSADLLEVLNALPLVFEPHSSVIPVAQQPALIRVAQSLKQYPQYQIKIIGHTELLGAADYAEEIALQRAQALQAFWIAQGVLAKQLSVDSRGQRQPMAENVTPYGRWLNRRMMFEVTEQTNSTNPAAP